MATIATADPAVPVRGQGGLLEVRAELAGGRTRFTELRQRPPLGISRAVAADPAFPRMASAMLTSAAGGVLQGDVLETRVAVGPGARLHLGTQSATRFYRMPQADARLAATYTVAEDAWLEVVPDPWLPYAGATIGSRTRCEVQPGGVLVLVEHLLAGRVARGERLAFDRIETVTDVVAGGRPVARDVLRVVPGAASAGIGALGPWSAVASMLVVAPGVTGALLAAAAAGVPGATAAWSGASDLPGGHGAWLRVLGDDETDLGPILRAAWAAVRVTLGGPPPPEDRRG